jgi:hypothetical protein
MIMSSKDIKFSSRMFFLAGTLWVLEAVAEIFGGYVEDFSSIYDYMAEITFGPSFLALFLGCFFLAKHHHLGQGRKQGWLGKIGLFFLALSAFILTTKSLVNVLYHSLTDGQSLFQFGSILNPLFLLAIPVTLLGCIIYGVSCLTGRVLPWWAALLLAISIFLVFVPVVGKYLAALVYLTVGMQILKKQETSHFMTNNNLTLQD